MLLHDPEPPPAPCALSRVLHGAPPAQATGSTAWTGACRATTSAWACRRRARTRVAGACTARCWPTRRSAHRPRSSPPPRRAAPVPSTRGGLPCALMPFAARCMYTGACMTACGPERCARARACVSAPRVRRRRASWSCCGCATPARCCACRARSTSSASSASSTRAHSRRAHLLPYNLSYTRSVL